MNRIIALLTLATLASTAAAQVLPRVPGTDAGIAATGDGTLMNENVTATKFTADNQLGLLVRAGFNYQMPRQNSEGRVNYGGALKFDVGPIPVRITAWAHTAGAKWVNGGGNATNPQTTIRAFYNIREIVDENVRPLIASESVNDSLDGNGVRLFNHNTPVAFSTVLAANRVFELEVDVTSRFLIPNWNNESPSVTITNEAGGLGDNFDGFRISFTYEFVPAPGPAAALGLGVLTLSRRRRGTPCWTLSRCTTTS
jgi:hypothetical protein